MEVEFDFPKIVESLAGGVLLGVCSQCGACSAICPMASSGRETVRQVIQGVRNGLREWVLKGQLPAVCTVCGYCGTVCPQGIEVSEVMYALKRVVLASRSGGTSLFRDCFSHLTAALITNSGKESRLAKVLDREPLALLAFGPMALTMVGEEGMEVPRERRGVLEEVRRMHQAALEMGVP
ncbi:hypothetical protein SY88_18550 [Clostridiales bacterium PH28_bin88]|nr:hypothetical protein SY88_18550 [Clostridiales bacterium PH28_bin88]